MLAQHAKTFSKIFPSHAKIFPRDEVTMIGVYRVDGELIAPEQIVARRVGGRSRRSERDRATRITRHHELPGPGDTAVSILSRLRAWHGVNALNEALVQLQPDPHESRAGDGYWLPGTVGQVLHDATRFTACTGAR